MSSRGVGGSPSENKRLALAVPSPGGEGQDEGEPKNQLKRSTSPQPSPPRRGRIVRRYLRTPRDWICRTCIRKTRDQRLLFLLPGGEGQDEGEPKNTLPISFAFPASPAKLFPLPLGGEG